MTLLTYRDLQLLDALMSEVKNPNSKLHELCKETKFLEILSGELNTSGVFEIYIEGLENEIKYLTSTVKGLISDIAMLYEEHNSVCDQINNHTEILIQLLDKVGINAFVKYNEVSKHYMTINDRDWTDQPIQRSLL